MALGAMAGRVPAGIVSETLRLTVISVAIGIVASVAPAFFRRNERLGWIR
jgi:ABC-type arginine/histidine transport system permease subunit